MSDDKKEGNCCHSGCCHKGIKILVLLLIAGFIFASGMWYGKSQCNAAHGFCAFTAPATK